MHRVLRNVRTLLRSPRTLRSYARYKTSSLLHGDACKSVHGITLSSFANFSEFLNCDPLSPLEYGFLTTFDFGRGCLIDVGANLGIVTAVLARRFPERPVFAFEPGPSTFESLKSTVTLNRLNNVRLSRCAVLPGCPAFRRDEVPVFCFPEGAPAWGYVRPALIQRVRHLLAFDGHSDDGQCRRDGDAMLL